MNEFFALLVLGHLLGDFFLQNKWMAMNKQGSTWKCAVHCAIYTGAVTLTTWPAIHGWAWSLLVFCSHFPIDRWSLADKWLDLINGRSLWDFMWFGHRDIHLGNTGAYGASAEFVRKNYHILRGGFHAVVYTVVDSTMHLFLMYYGAQLLTR